jgi:hypothetical protein
MNRAIMVTIARTYCERVLVHSAPLKAHDEVQDRIVTSRVGCADIEAVAKGLSA